MINPLPLLVFTDLDGTLISHSDYCWTAAVPALQALRDAKAGVVLASSKTALEMIEIRRALDLDHWPAIVENGAGVLAANTQTAPEDHAYVALRAKLLNTPEHLRRQFQGFGDMTVAQICETTGLAQDAAALAARRAYSEPGLWTGAATDRAAFLHALAQQGIAAREGGRFLTLSFGQTKADRMADIITRYHPRYTVALGDAPNDIEMLEAADFGVIVANPHRSPLPDLAGEKSGQISRTTLAGPEGWNQAVLDLIARLDLK